MNWKPEMDELRRREEFAERAGRRRQGQAPARRRPAHGPRAHRPAGRPGQLPRDRHHRRQGRATTASNDLDRAHARQLRVRPRAGSTAGRSWSAATTSRCAAARPTPPSRASTIMSERMANELRLPIIRLIEGSGGGGSVKTIETTGRANVPGRATAGSGSCDNMGTVPRVALGLGSVAGLGAAHLAAAHYSVMVKDNVGDVRRRPAGGRAARPEAHQEGARRLGDPAARPARSTTRSTPRRRRSRARGASSPTCRPRSTSVPPRGPQHRRSASAARSGCSTRSRATSARSTRCARSSRRSSTRARSSRCGRSTAARSSPGFARLDGWPVAVMASDPYLLRRRLDGRRLPEGRALRRPRRDLPPAGRLSRATARAS